MSLSESRQRRSAFALKRWVFPPSLLSMDPKRSMSPSRTARSGICPEPNQLLFRYETHTEASTFSLSAADALPNTLNRM